MARTRPPDFLDRLIQAGLEVFGRKGLKGARMSDVAKHLRVSQGTLYNYVESKEALFALLVERGAEEGPIELPSKLPIPTPEPEELLARLERRMAETFALPRLEEALAGEPPPDVRPELTALVEELYDRTEATRGPATALERSALELPRIFQLFYLGFRRELFGRYGRYVASRAAAGGLRRSADPRIPARFLVETVTFFARHRYRDPDPTLLPDPIAVRDGVVPMIVDALAGPEGERDRTARPGVKP